MIEAAEQFDGLRGGVRGSHPFRIEHRDDGLDSIAEFFSCECLEAGPQ
jgi:hypothetical protein